MQPNDYLSESMEKDCSLGVIDLFSGAGGMSLGFKKAEFDIICGVEIERRSAETYSKNFPYAKMLNQDIGSVTDCAKNIPNNRIAINESYYSKYVGQ